MKKRVHVLSRIGRFQSQMHELSRSRLAELEREQGNLSDEVKAIFETMEAGELAYGAPARLRERRLRTLRTKLNSLAREQESARSRTLIHGMRAKLAEQAAEAAEEARLRLKARSELADLIEQAIARRDTSPT